MEELKLQKMDTKKAVIDSNETTPIRINIQESPETILEVSGEDEGKAERMRVKKTSTSHAVKKVDIDVSKKSHSQTSSIIKVENLTKKSQSSEGQSETLNSESSHHSASL